MPGLTTSQVPGRPASLSRWSPFTGGMLMKLKALLLACAVAGAGASFAMADGGHDGVTAIITEGTTTARPRP